METPRPDHEVLEDYIKGKVRARGKPSRVLADEKIRQCCFRAKPSDGTAGSNGK